MTREIKFRSWDKILKIMCYNPVNAINFNGQFLLNDGKFHDINKTDYILMQYTGLKDKNGKEIYENDIIRVNDDRDGDRTYEVIFEKGCYWGNCIYSPRRTTPQKTLLCDLDFFVHQSQEIIGNIYENPELIGDKND